MRRSQLSKSKSKSCYDRRSIGRSVLVSSTHVGPKTRFFCCQTVAGLLMRGALSDEGRDLSFIIAAGLRQRGHSRVRVSRDSWSYFTVSDSGLPPPTWRARSPYLYLPGTEWPIYTPRHWVPFSSPLTTRRATVKIFEPGSTRRTSVTIVRNELFQTSFLYNNTWSPLSRI
jgi:hypothetical protein